MSKNKKNTEVTNQVSSYEESPFQSAIDASEALFEKHLLHVSSGALGLSLLFAEKLTPSDVIIARQFLVIGWAFLALSLVLNLASHLIAVRFMRKSEFEFLSGDAALQRNQTKRNKLLTGFNWVSIVLLIIGVASILTFASINYLKK